MKLQPIAKNTLIKIIAIWVILGVVGGIGFNVYKRIKDMPLSAEIVEEEIAYAYAPEEEPMIIPPSENIQIDGSIIYDTIEDSNPFEEYLEEFEEEYVTPQGYIDTRPAPIPLPSAHENTVYPSGKGEIVSQSKPVIIVNEPTPVAAVAPAPLFTEAVLVSLITTIGATLNTLLLVFKKKS